MSTAPSEYDVFLSYSHDDTQWVEENLYAPLCRYRFESNGHRPRVFFDRSKEGIRVGQVWIDAIADAIAQSPWFIPVYSASYFQRPMCMHELRIALGINPGKLNPIMLVRRGQEPDALARQLPTSVIPIHYLLTSEPDWFERLCAVLNLRPETEQAALAFLDQPATVLVNHTLPPIRVAIQTKAGNEILPREDAITLSAEGCTVHGTLTVKADRGTARFSDLSIADVQASTRLVARAEGLEPVHSNPFAVAAQAAPATPTRVPPQIPWTGEAVFFSSGRALAVIRDDAVRIYSLAGEALLPQQQVPFTGRLRLRRRGGPYIVLADWSGTIYVFREDGAFRTWSFGSNGGGFVVPAEVVIDGDQIYVGFWSGAVWRLSLSAEPALVLSHDGGVQALAAAHGRLHVCGFDGNLWSYQVGQRMNARMLEPAVWLLKAYPDCLLAVGDRRMYHIKLDSPQVFDEPLPVGEVAATLGEGEMAVVIDQGGAGACLKADLVRAAGFRTAPGAVPVDCDRSGRYCVLANLDGSRTLLVQNRIVFSHVEGTLAVAPSGDRYALGERNGIRILDASEMEALIQGALAK